MITLDHIKQLDRKVHKAIDEINTLRAENKMLLEDLDKYQHRIEELEIMINAFKEDQSEIENGIIDALNQLDVLEDTIAASEPDSVKIVEPEDEKPEPASEGETVQESIEPGLSEKTAVQGKTSGEGESELDIF